VKDLTEHSIGKHILQMAVPIAAGMFFQTLYILIDLYFVAHFGDAALAGAAQFLQVISWNFVASGLVFTCSALFQGLGHTMPAVLSSATRSEFRRARALARRAAAVRADSALVCIGREHGAAGAGEPVAGARRIPPPLDRGGRVPGSRWR